jgi:hypothetical protein
VADLVNFYSSRMRLRVWSWNIQCNYDALWSYTVISSDVIISLIDHVIRCSVEWCMSLTDHNRNEIYDKPPVSHSLLIVWFDVCQSIQTLINWSESILIRKGQLMMTISHELKRSGTYDENKTDPWSSKLHLSYITIPISKMNPLNSVLNC